MERIAGEVERELARGGAGRGGLLAAVTTAWVSTVGDAVARNAWPSRIARDGTLHVATSSATWAFELDRLSPEIEERLRSVLGEDAPGRVRFAVGPVPEAAPTTPADGALEKTPDPPPEVVRAAASAAATIDDPELRRLVVRAARASLARAASDRRF
jgi:hypothetical protein